MTNETFEIPEVSGRKGISRWDSVIAEVVNAAGDWLVIDHNLKRNSVSPFASRLRNGKHVATASYPPGAFDVRVKNGEVFIRYTLGDE